MSEVSPSSPIEDRAKVEKKIASRQKWRTAFSMLLMVVGFVSIGVKLFTIQIVNQSFYEEKSNDQRLRTIEFQAARGDIIDRNGIILARSVDGYSFAVDPVHIQWVVEYDLTKKLPLKEKEIFIQRNQPKIESEIQKKKKELATYFSNTFGKPIEYYMGRLNRNERFVWLERYVQMTKATQIVNLNSPFLISQKEKVRQYETLASQVIGITDVNNTGVIGVERSLNKYLSGDSGKFIYERLQKGGARISLENKQIEPKKGGTIELTIDSKIQAILEDELQRGITDAGAEAGFGAIMNVRTGEILAMANSPTFNMNKRETRTDESERNRVVADALEPGSTFKLVMLTTAIEKNRVYAKEKFNLENGTYKYYDKVVKDHSPDKSLTFLDAFKHSSNIAMVKLSDRISKEEYYNKVKEFGFGERTGIENFYGEMSGVVKDPSRWTGITKAWMSHGYEVQVTPMQLLNAYACIANGGVLMRPYLIKSITPIHGEKEEYKEKVIRRVVSEKVAKEVTRYLKAVVDSGTGIPAQIAQFSVAGKTGTAQQLVRNSYKSGNYLSSFVGFFPAEYPMYAMVIGVQNPTKGYYGSMIAAPVFSKVGARFISSIDDRLRKILIAKTDTKSKTKEEQFLKESRQVIVPDLKGFTEREAKKILRFYKLDYQKKDFVKALKSDSTDYVESQAIPAGKFVAVWTKIPVQFTKKGNVPNLVGLRVDRAIAIASECGLKVTIANHQTPTHTLKVKEQFPKKGELIKTNTECRLIVH